MENILLTGFKACGKSSLGRKLAWQLGMEFVDLDKLLEDRYAMENERLAFRDIYRELGGEAFRRLEAQVAESLLQSALDGADTMVVGLGGGALHNEAAREHLLKLGHIIYLDVPIDELVQRASRRGFPAYIDAEDAEAGFRQKFGEREAGYRLYSNQVVQLRSMNHGEAVQRIIDTLQGKA